MTPMEIALLITGVIIFVISFLMPEVPMKKSDRELAAEKEEAKRLVEQEVDTMRLKVGEATSETVEYAVEKAERSLERVSNDKIMAVGEYAGTVLEEINKSHQEVMFLYDMLKDKQTDLNNTIREADAAAHKIENISHNAMDASETLLRGMSVASVSQKGLTNEQKSVFDIEIPDAQPVVFENGPAATAAKSGQKSRGRALTQSKIEAQLLGIDKPDDAIAKAITADAPEPLKEKVVYDILSGGAYKGGNIVGVEAPSSGAATTADFEALSSAAAPAQPAPAAAPQASTAATTGPEAPALSEFSGHTGNSNDKILAMAEQGFDKVQIAKTLGLGIGEVKLVLDLFK